MNPAVRMAAERLIVRAESCAPDVSWTNVSVPKPDVLLVARAALESDRAASTVETLRAALRAVERTLLQAPLVTPYRREAEALVIVREALAAAPVARAGNQSSSG